jgi:hypothetical protein
MNYSRWALPKERLFPIDTPELVKTAAEAFGDQADNMSSAQRLVCARHICERADELGVSVHSSMAYKYAGSHLNDHFPQFLAMRKESSAHADDQALDQLLAVARHFNSIGDVSRRVAGLDKVAMLLEDFDRRHGVDDVPDAAFSVYGLTVDRREPLRMVVKVAGIDVTSTDLEGVDFEVLRGKIEDSVVDGLSGVSGDDRLAVFSSLPEPHREIVYQTLFL